VKPTSLTGKYDTLKELIGEWIEREEENLEEARASAGINCAGAGMAMGALDAYRQVLSDIADLEAEVTPS
jgi:hypothetical protein